MLVRKYYSNTNVQDNNGRTALIHAALTNDTELASFLVKECKADVNLQTKWKDTALHFAVSHDNHEMVKLLVQDGGANMKVVNSDLKRPKALAKSREVRSIHTLGTTISRARTLLPGCIRIHVGFRRYPVRREPFLLPRNED